MANTPKNNHPLAASELRPTPGARLLGAASETETLSVTIVLRRRPEGPPTPKPADYLQTPPLQRRPLSESDFAARYGADPADIEKVVAFAQSQGLTVDETNAARRTIVVSGTVGQFNRAFGISLQNYQHEVQRSTRSGPQTETYRGYDGLINVPEDLAEIIVGVFGLDNRRISKRNTGDPPNTQPIPISTVRTLYDFPGNSAAGQTIAIFSEGGYLATDISANFGGHPPSLIDIAVDAPNGNFADFETTQDIYISGSAAPGARIAVYFTTYSQKGWVDLIGRVIHPSAGDPVCSVLSSSFYVSDGDDPTTLAAEGVPVSWITAVTQLFQDAAMQGVTICIASGDTGAQSKRSDRKAHVQYPASDPWVLGVGGTTIGDVVGTSFEEWAWNDDTGASGGGVSDHFSLPSYQSDANVPPSVNDGHHGRGVPDVSANASPNSGYPFILDGGPAPAPANGTSASAPLWAGLIALLNAALGTNIGFANPVLYGLKGQGFHDILPEPGAANNDFGGVTGYPVTPGWDAVTGWGSPQGLALLNALNPIFNPPPPESKICQQLVQNIRKIIIDNGPALTVAQFAGIRNQLEQCVRQGFLTQATVNAVIAEYENWLKTRFGH